MAGKPFKRTILETAGVTSVASSVVEVHDGVDQIHLISKGLQNGDKVLAVQIDISPDSIAPGTPEFTDYYIDGVQQAIDATTGSLNTGVVLRAAGTYRINKGTSSGAVTVQALYQYKKRDAIA